MKLKIFLATVLSGAILLLTAAPAFAWVDSLGRVWPGKKPVAKRVIKKSVKKPAPKPAPKTKAKK